MVSFIFSFYAIYLGVQVITHTHKFKSISPKRRNILGGNKRHKLNPDVQRNSFFLKISRMVDSLPVE